LLQGRNFSYLDTQLKRLGGPNFTHLPINAPKCPFHHFQQDGHMAMVNPKGRANYEPNSWPGADGGPRESPDRGFQSYPAGEEGTKGRYRSETFADHYSQARQFYISQTHTEQDHLARALVFELSKCERPDIRGRMVAHLRNIDEDLAQKVAAGLALKELPDSATAARPTRKDLKKSPALSILLNGPETFKGRKVGVLLTDGVDFDLFTALKSAVKKEGALMEIVAPKVGGVQASNGTWIEAVQKIDGGPSVLYDAVALLVSEAGGKLLVKESAARDFVADAFAHMKFIGHVEAAAPLLEKAGVYDSRDEGFIELDRRGGVAKFIEACRQLRLWKREAAVHLALTP
jgi:catalase